MGGSSELRRGGIVRVVPVIAIAVVLFAVGGAGCSSSPSSEDASGITTTTFAATSTSRVSTSEPGVTEVSTSQGSPTTGAVIMPPSTSPGVTLAEPPKMTVPMLVTLPPGVTLFASPKITSFTVQTSWTCVQAAQANFMMSVSWKSSGATQVELGAFGTVYPGGQPNATVKLGLTCGSQIELTVTPIAANGTRGVTKKATVTVAAS